MCAAAGTERRMSESISAVSLRFIKPGDVIELEVERIGVLRNRVVAHA